MLVTCLSLLTLEMVFRLLEEPSLGHMLKVNLRYIYYNHGYRLSGIQYLVQKLLIFMAILQSEIMSKPELFVEPDPELPLALLDQKEVFFCNFLSLHIM